MPFFASTGGLWKVAANGCGSRLAAMRLASSSFVLATRSTGKSTAALPKTPSFSRSRRDISIPAPGLVERPLNVTPNAPPEQSDAGDDTAGRFGPRQGGLLGPQGSGVCAPPLGR